MPSTAHIQSDGPSRSARPAPDVRPRLAAGVRRRFDQARGRDVLLGPETVVVLNATGAAIVKLCDGRRTVADIEAELRRRYAHVDDGQVATFLTRLRARHCVVLPQPEVC